MNDLYATNRMSLGDAAQALLDDEGDSWLVAIFRAGAPSGGTGVLAAGVTELPDDALELIASMDGHEWSGCLVAWVPLADESPATVRRARAILDPEFELIDPADSE